MGLMVLASELFMMMINVCVQGGRRRRVSMCVCGCVCVHIYDDDEWRAPSPHTPHVYCVQTQRNDLGRHTVM